MYEDLVEMLYNEKFGLTTNKMVNDIITDYIFNNFNNNYDLISNLYDVLKDIFIDHDIIVKGGIATQLITEVNFKNIKGDLDISITINDNLFKNIILFNTKNKYQKQIKINHIFPYIDESTLYDKISNVMLKYINEISDITNNIDFKELIPISSIYNNNIYIAGTYNKVYNEISSIKNGKFDNKLNYTINIIDNKFILIRFFYNIIFDCKIKKHYYSFVLDDINEYKCKFLFLDISIIPSKNNIKNDKIYKYLVNSELYIISNQIQTLLNSFILQHKIQKRVERMAILLKKYKHQLIESIDGNVTIEKDKILFSKLQNLFEDEYPMKNYFYFKNLLYNDKIIYLINNISVYELKDINVINVKPKKYIKRQLKKMIKIMDNMIQDNLNIKLQSGKIINDKFEFDEKILRLISKEFNLSINEIKNIKYNKSKYDAYIKLYYDIYI